jgi:replicative DNA helicase
MEHRQAVAGKAELIIAKVRDGDTGVVNLRFAGATTSFSEIVS